MRRTAPSRGDDALPPNNEEAEYGVIGCILLAGTPDGVEVFREVERRIGGKEECFYDLRHREIWLAMRGLEGEGKPIETLLLMGRLRDHGKLDSIGGLAYLSGAADKVPSAANLDFYLKEVLSKYLARCLIQGSLGMASALQAQGQFNAGIVAQFVEGVELIRRAAAPEEVTKRIRQPLDYGEAVYNLWFGSEKGEPGLRLPPDVFGDFPFKVRGGELTLMVGDSGAGKSTVLSYFLLHLMHQGAPCVLASMEMKPAVTISVLVSQLIGTKFLPDNGYGHGTLARAMKWLQPRLLIYDFLGITDWRELVRVLTEVAEGLKGKETGGEEVLPDGHREKGGEESKIRIKDQDQGASARAPGERSQISFPRVVVGVDNMMRLGFAEDDLSAQDACAQHLTTWVQEWNAHMFLLNHTTKGEGNLKQRTRLSKRWTDAAQNIAEVGRNETKQEKVDELRQQLKEKKIDGAKFEEKMEEFRTKSDGWFTLAKQRLPGSRQNGKRHYWFHAGSLQYAEEPRAEGIDWLERWAPSGAARKKG